VSEVGVSSRELGGWTSGVLTLTALLVFPEGEFGVWLDLSIFICCSTSDIFPHHFPSFFFRVRGSLYLSLDPLLLL